MTPTPQSRTSLGVHEIRARILYDAIRAHPETVWSVDDIPKLERVRGWTEHILTTTIADLIYTGAIVDDCRGIIVVRPWPNWPTELAA